MSSLTKSAITSKIFLALAIACRRHAVASAKPNTINCQSGSSCRRIFSLASGHAMPTAQSRSSKRVTSKKQCAPPLRLAMTDCNAVREVALSQIRLRTALPNNECAGFVRVTRRGICVRAIRLTRASCKSATKAKRRRVASKGVMQPEQLWRIARQEDKNFRIVVLGNVGRRCKPKPFEQTGNGVAMAYDQSVAVQLT